MELLWSPRAKHRLAEYAQQLAEYDYPEPARDWLLSVKDATEHLADFPRAGRVSPEFTDMKPVIHDITIGNYRAFYRIKRRAVEIISVHNCKQAILSLRSL